jgi:LETM1 and EF-hand domain-containing protein 1
MEELVHEQKRIASNRKDGTDEAADSIASEQEASASDMLKFLDLARKGEMVPPDAIIQYAALFQDDLTLDNMPRMQLINMCKYMSIPPYGADSFLRFQLRHRIRNLKEDDQRILWEGIDSLTKMELREACQERGMRSTGLSKEAYKRSLQQWLDLSVNKNVSISLLIMSRTFFLQEEIISPAKAAASDETQSVTGLADAISGMDKEVLNEVILQVATSEEFKSDPDVRKIQLEVVTHQNEKIKEEQAERDAKKKKDTSEKEELQAAAPETETKDTAPEVDMTSPDETITKEEILDAIDEKVEELQEDLVEKASEIEMGERELSPEEMESISQLLSADPVQKERESLARIKEAMREEAEPETEVAEDPESASIPATPDTQPPIEIDDSEKEAATIIEKLETEAAKEADESTSFSKESELESVDGHLENDGAEVIEEDLPEEIAAEEPEDPVVARLKKRIESMVDKIELQLSDVQVKIGDKLHYLDKDMDGILSREEMADVLSQVLKKDLSFEEALEIADEMVRIQRI